MRPRGSSLDKRVYPAIAPACKLTEGYRDGSTLLSPVCVDSTVGRERSSEPLRSAGHPLQAADSPPPCAFWLFISSRAEASYARYDPRGRRRDLGTLRKLLRAGRPIRFAFIPGRSYCFLLSSASSFERSSHRPFVGRKCCSQGRVLDPWPLTYAEEVTARTSRPVSKSRVERTPSVSRG